jgi:hypothetical protein
MEPSFETEWLFKVAIRPVRNTDAPLHVTGFPTHIGDFYESFHSFSYRVLCIYYLIPRKSPVLSLSRVPKDLPKKIFEKVSLIAKKINNIYPLKEKERNPPYKPLFFFGMLSHVAPP